MKVVVPTTEEALERHYQMRYETLRLPWGQPPGSERDGSEHDNVLASAIDDAGNCIGVARLLPLPDGQAQIRSMGVADSARGKGVGKALLQFLESRALELKTQHIVLHARENAVPFYEAAGYRLVHESYLLWGTIQHFKMEKVLKMSAE